MSNEVEASKRKLRRRIRTLLTALPDARIRSGSLAVSEALFASAFWREAAWVFCFMSLPGEVYTQDILNRAWTEGKQVGIPRIREGEILFHAYTQQSEPLVISRYGIAEPHPSWPLLVPEQAPPGGLLVVCPGLAFDRQGRRLGRGGGYYDRFLESLRSRPELRFTALGVCLSEQLLDSLPVAAHDQRLDALACEKRVIKVSG
jgi:5-formyltetrahydrofolate cyclo-ligase